MKIIYVRIETTGIACPESGLVQLTGAVEVDGEVKERFNFPMRPFPNDIVSQEGIGQNSASARELAARDNPARVFEKFVALLDRYVDRYDRFDKFHLVAYNARFDAEHLRAWFEKNRDRYFSSWFWHPAIDAMNFAATVLMGARSDVVDFKLGTVAELLGVFVEQERVHEPEYAIELTRIVFGRLLDRFVPDRTDKMTNANSKELSAS